MEAIVREAVDETVDTILRHMRKAWAHRLGTEHENLGWLIHRDGRGFDECKTPGERFGWISRVAGLAREIENRP